MSANTELLLNKVALVTGASSGIGEAIAKLLVILGVHVIGLARRGERLQRIANSLKGSKGTFDPYAGNVRNESNILDVFEYAEAHYKGIDFLINNAGILYGEKITEAPTAHFRNVLDTNLLAAAVISREAVKSMRNKPGPKQIVNIMSTLALDATLSSVNTGLYPASEFGLHALTEDLRQEMSQTNTSIKVTGIYPGIVKTELFRKGGLPDNKVFSHPYLNTAAIANAVVYAITRRGNVQVNQLVVEPLHATYG